MEASILAIVPSGETFLEAPQLSGRGVTQDAIEREDA
jgi:hypothetical protein